MVNVLSPIMLRNSGTLYQKKSKRLKQRRFLTIDLRCFFLKRLIVRALRYFKCAIRDGVDVQKGAAYCLS